MSHFFAYLSRMRLIWRWGLMRNTQKENIQEHSLQVATVAHALALIRNAYHGGQVDAERVMALAMFHEVAEVFTGDLPTPIKYFNPGIRDAFKSIEHIASQKLMEYLPQDLRRRAGGFRGRAAAAAAFKQRSARGCGHLRVFAAAGQHFQLRQRGLPIEDLNIV